MPVLCHLRVEVSISMLPSMDTVTLIIILLWFATYTVRISSRKKTNGISYQPQLHYPSFSLPDYVPVVSHEGLRIEEPWGV